MFKHCMLIIVMVIIGSDANSASEVAIQNRSNAIEKKALDEKSQRDQEEARKIELQRQRQWNQEHPGVPYPQQPTPGNSTVTLQGSTNPVINKSREIESRALTEKCQQEQAEFQRQELQRERQWVEENPGVPYPRKGAPACGTPQNPSANSPQSNPTPPATQPINVRPEDEITKRSREIEARALTEKCLREQADQRALELQRERQWIEEKPGIPYPRKPLMSCGENKIGNERGNDRPDYMGDANNRQQNTTDEAILRQLREAREKIDEAERMIRNRLPNPGPQSNNNQSLSPQDDILRRSREIQAQGEQRKLNEQQSENRSNRLAQIRQTIELNPQSPYVNRVAEIDPATGSPKKKPGFTSNDLKPNYLDSYLATMPGIDTRY